MYIQNRRSSSNFNGCSPLQNRNGLISLKPAIAYFAYTCRQPVQKIISQLIISLTWRHKYGEYILNSPSIIMHY